jgi:hypothetical protein
MDWGEFIEAVGEFGTLVGAVVAAIAVARGVQTLYRRTIGRRRDAYRRLERLGTNAQVAFFSAVLGEPLP